MGKVIINQGKTNTLVITIPAKGDVDWAAQIRQAFQDICDHDHTGGIKGKKITGDALADNTITINNIDLSSVNLNTFLDIQDGTTIPSGSILMWSEENQEWYPTGGQNMGTASNVYVITNDTDLNGYDPTPGDILYVDSQGQSNPFNNGVVGAADFSFYNKNLKGVKIISNNIPLVMAELNECKIISNHSVILNGNVNNSDLHAQTLLDTSTTVSVISNSQGFFHQLNLTSASTTIAASSKIEATEGIISLSGTPSFSGTTSDPVTILDGRVCVKKMPNSITLDDKDALQNIDDTGWLSGQEGAKKFGALPVLTTEGDLTVSPDEALSPSNYGKFPWSSNILTDNIHIGATNPDGIWRSTQVYSEIQPTATYLKIGVSDGSFGGGNGSLMNFYQWTGNSTGGWYPTRMICNTPATFNAPSAAQNNFGYDFTVNYKAKFDDDLSVAGTFSNTSDYRLKDNITSLQNASSLLMQLNPCRYTWKKDGKEDIGFVAHEVQEVLPDLVVGEKDALKEDGSIKAQGIAYVKLTALLTASLKEALLKIDSLEERIKELENKEIK